MKKTLFALPLLAALALVGCGKDNEQSGQNSGSDDDEEEEFEPIDKRGPETVGDFVRVDTLVEGEEYYFGFYNPAMENLRLSNGDFHVDGSKYYPYYMGTTETTGATEGLAKFTVNYVSSTEFTILVSCEDGPWNGKYLSVYAAVSGYNNNVMSLAPVDDVNGQYNILSDGTNPSPKGVYTDVYGKFTFLTDTETAQYNTIGLVAQHMNEDNERLWLFGCKADEYISIDCSNEDKALAEEYSVAHFYKLAE